MKLTKKQINLIVEQTRPELIGTHQHIHTWLGSYMPSNANWGYHAGWTKDGDLVVTVFGEVMGK